MSREIIIKVLDREEIDAHARESFCIDEKTHEAKVELLAPYQNMGELIRCIDCKYFDGEYCHSEDLDLCLEPMGFSGALFCPPEDFYCGYSKRREERK